MRSASPTLIAIVVAGPLVVGVVAGGGCAASRGPAPSSTVCAPSGATSSVTGVTPPAVPTTGVPQPDVVCDRLRRLAGASGANAKDLDEFVPECMEELRDTREDDPRAYACEARCFMIVPGVDTDVGCEDLCASDAADDCKEWRSEDGTVSDAATAACRDHVARIQATADDKTLLCALACASMGGSVRAIDECFSHCL